MAAKILLSLLLLFVASDAKTRAQNLCPAIQNTNSLCAGQVTQYQCICDFTCSEWDKPCNWVLTCEEEIMNINSYRAISNKLQVFRLPNRNHKECLDININTHKHKNCCDMFCAANIKDVCF
ncbi:hypothetical protein KR009_011332 [Drosophila setifemur]|nr:hypothetical protein KR009_011332 [Drosophila setifemur]